MYYRSLKYISLSLTGGFLIVLTACGSSDNNHSKHLGSTDDGGEKTNDTDDPTRDGSKPGSAENIANNDGGHELNAKDTGEIDSAWSAQLDSGGGAGPLAWLPESIDFGIIALGCNSQDIKVNLYNNSKAPVNVFEATTKPNPMFKIIRTTPALSYESKVKIPIGESMEIVLRYSPGIPPQLEEGSLAIKTDASNVTNGEVVIPLKGAGVSRTEVVDEFPQIQKRQEDILWIVDNSKSMEKEQEHIVANVTQFMKYYAESTIDYHIGVITTETNELQECMSQGIKPGRLYAASGNPRFITPQTPNGLKVIAQNIQVGTCSPDGQEAGLEAVRMALSEPFVSDIGANAGFLRGDARLILIFVSDADDNSPYNLVYYVDFLRSIHGLRNYDLLTFCIIGGVDGNLLTPSECTSDYGNATAADRYYKVYREINNGLALSICDENYAENLNKLGSMDVFISRVQHVLSQPADPSTIQVFVNEQFLPEDVTNSGFGWTYDEATNSVIFGETSIPPQGSKIKIIYKKACL